MLSLKKIMFAVAVAVGMASTGSPAQAWERTCNGPFCNSPRYPTLGAWLFNSHAAPALPTFQAAPWYLYWPYDGHFQMPPPGTAPSHRPPVAGNSRDNPYSRPRGGVYGPIPGGPPPAGYPVPLPPPAGFPFPPQ